MHNFIYLHPQNRDMKKFYIIFFLVNLLLSSWFLDTWNNANTTSRALPIVSYFEQGNFRIDKYQDLTLDKAKIKGHYYTDKAPLPTLLVLPFYGLLENAGLIAPPAGNDPGKAVYIVGGLICGSLIFTLILVIAMAAVRKSKTGFSPVFLVMMPFYGSFIFVYSGTFYAHLMSSILILFGYLMIRKKQYVWAGIFSGLAFLSEYTLALFFPVWALQIWIQEKNFYKGFLFGLGTLPAILFIGIYNYIFTGSPFEMLYKYHTFQFLHENYGFRLPSLESIWGLTFSNFKGLFFYTPFLILFFFGMIKRTSWKKFSQHYLTWITLIFFLVIASYDVWWGGWCYGPRLLFPVAVLLVYEGIVQLSNQRFSKLFFWLLTGFGLAGAFLVKITVIYSIPSGSANPFFDTIFPNIRLGNFNPNNLMTMIFGMNPMMSGMIWLVLFLLSLIFLNRIFSKTKVSN